MSESASSNFIRSIIADDLQQGVVSEVVMRFRRNRTATCTSATPRRCACPSASPRSSGAAATCAWTTPTPRRRATSSSHAIERDIRWLGFEWVGPPQRLRLLRAALRLGEACSIREGPCLRGRAVHRRDPKRSAATRMQPHVPGVPGPYRDRPAAEESLERLEGMRTGGLRRRLPWSCAPRSISRAPTSSCATRSCTGSRTCSHHLDRARTWHIYPTYDWAHGQSDAIEGVTHSTCSLEFDVHRPLYDWFLENLPIDPPAPRQFEFARFNLPYTVMSKRKLTLLVARRAT